MVADDLILVHHLLGDAISFCAFGEFSFFGEVDALVDAQAVLVLQVQELPQGALDARTQAGAVRLFLEQVVGTEAVYCLHLLAD